MAKDKKSQTIITDLEKDGRIIQGNELYNELFKEVEKKFNPEGLKEKIIKSI